MPSPPIDVLSRVGSIATVLAVVALVVPPFSVAIGLVALGFSAAALRRARRRGVPNRLATICLTVSGGLVVVVIAGSALYSALD
ncbi:MAG: hypothetical protein AB7L13_08945 [Acidimicrobiia bacterium]